MTNHKSVLQAGTTDPARSHRGGVTSDGAENPPRLRVTCGEDSQESGPPVKRRVETHTASAQGSSTPVPWRWRSRRARIRGSPRPRSPRQPRRAGPKRAIYIGLLARVDVTVVDWLHCDARCGVASPGHVARRWIASERTPGSTKPRPRKRWRVHLLAGTWVLPAALGSPVGGGARSSFTGGPRSSSSTGFRTSAHTW